MDNLNHIKNQNGFGVLGALIGAAALMSVGMAVNQMNHQQSNMASYLEDQLSVITLKGDAQVTLNSPQACIRSLGRVSPEALISAQRLENIVLVSDHGEIAYQRGTEYEKIRIGDLSVQAEEPFVAGTSGRVRFVITPERTRGNESQSLAPIVIRRLVTLNAASEVVNCQPIDPGSSDPSSPIAMMPSKKCLQTSDSLPIISTDSYLSYTARDPASDEYKMAQKYRTGITIPADARGMTISLSPRIFRTGSGPTGTEAPFTDHEVPGKTFSIRFGKTSLYGKVLEPGKVLRFKPGSFEKPGMWMYDELLIAIEGHRYGSAPTDVVPPTISPALEFTSVGSTCPSSNSVAQSDGDSGRLLTWK